MGAQLLALHVWDEPAFTGLSLALAAISLDAEATLVDQLRHDVTSQLDDTGIDWAFDAYEGEAAATLERVAEQEHADLIVVGAPSRWHLLSVATRLVRRATRPIVVIP
jgi:nucleotide-binding universal stress UspA family protein